jgi:hypothetical protein
MFITLHLYAYILNKLGRFVVVIKFLSFLASSPSLRSFVTNKLESGGDELTSTNKKTRKLGSVQ